MNKQIFITNGMARCGKDTFAKFLNEIIPTLKYSSIDKVKNIAKLCGWNGGKSDKDRKFLSDLKLLTSDYSDMPFEAIKQKVDNFMKDKKHSVMLIDIREPEEIKKVVDRINALTLLITSKRVEKITSNKSDASVLEYDYDDIISNDGTIEELEVKAKSYVKKLVR